MTNNSPNQVISRLIHKGDYFNNLSEYSLNEFKKSILFHVKQCQHNFCKDLNWFDDTEDDISKTWDKFLQSFSNGKEYIN
jgi:F0F1-type ATP synthase alpha subunit